MWRTSIREDLLPEISDKVMDYGELDESSVDHFEHVFIGEHFWRRPDLHGWLACFGQHGIELLDALLGDIRQAEIDFFSTQVLDGR